MLVHAQRDRGCWGGVSTSHTARHRGPTDFTSTQDGCRWQHGHPNFEMPGAHQVSFHREHIGAGGVQLTHTSDEGVVFQKFGGHAMRVSGAMMLAGAGVPVSMVQMLGRWSSCAVERYVQAAPIVAVPSIPSDVLRGEHHLAQPWACNGHDRPAFESHRWTRGGHSCGGHGQAQITQMKRALRALRELVCKPQEHYIVRPRSQVVHVARIDEQANVPAVWQTRCGWAYGTSRFFRVPSNAAGQVKCRKCFPEIDQPGDNQVDDASADGSDSSSDSSSSTEAMWSAGITLSLANTSGRVPA